MFCCRAALVLQVWTSSNRVGFGLGPGDLPLTNPCPFVPSVQPVHPRLGEMLKHDSETILSQPTSCSHPLGLGGELPFAEKHEPGCAAS